MKWVHKIIIGGVAIICTISDAMSAAWTLTAGQEKMIYQLLTYYTDSYYDTEGEEQSRDSFKKITFYNQYEYGWDDDTTIGWKLGLHYQEDVTEVTIADTTPITIDEKGYGLAFDMFVRQRLYQDKHHTIAVQPLLHIPTVSYLSTGRMHEGSWAVEGRVLHGYTHNLGGYDIFAGTEIATRLYTEVQDTAQHVDVTIGMHLNRKNMIIAQLFNSWNERSLASLSVFPTVTTDATYDLTKAQLSYVRRITDDMQLSLGGFYNIAGHNTGGGGGMSLSLWQAF